MGKWTKYAKLIDILTLEYAPDELNGIVGFNNDSMKCIELGYLPVKNSIKTGNTATYSAEDNVIKQNWVTLDEKIYSNRVVELIREKYDENIETAILRKKLAGIDSSFDSYNKFCEECKKKAKLEQINKIKNGIRN